MSSFEVPPGLLLPHMTAPKYTIHEVRHKMSARIYALLNIRILIGQSECLKPVKHKIKLKHVHWLCLRIGSGKQIIW